MNKSELLQLELKATEIRKQILEMIVTAQGTHIASAFSIVDIVLFLYSNVLNFNPKNPKQTKRDRFVLSKGHGCAALYVVLADFGFFPKSLLSSYTSPGSILGGHPDSLRIPGVETSTGSLGHGLSVSVGFALANKINKIQSRIYCLGSDGECNEGAIWEATMVAAHHKLDNLVLILDNNRLMISGFTKDILNPLSFSEKFRVFGWNIIEINGHNFNEMTEAFEKAPLKNGKPTVIIANTIRGKGISYMENSKEWYSMLPNEEQMGIAMGELNVKIEKIEKGLQK
ncbi:MAG: transketolase [Candidatus Daviesbacteria bacterium]|nr:transketolase [Candidatus Daviesbacteria bacterium]